MPLPPALIGALMNGEHADPFSVLGLHREGEQYVVRTLLPGAATVEVIDSATGDAIPAARLADSAIFEATVPAPLRYRLRVDFDVRTSAWART